MNISKYSDEQTATTDPLCAFQRAENLAILGASRVLELCVGPSLPTLERAYSRFGLVVYGNDIDRRWGKGVFNMIIGDALKIAPRYDQIFDTFVFAPPLSRGCSGKREDSLSIERVNPSYYEYLKAIGDSKAWHVLVLPARSLATSYDREQYHKLLNFIRRKYDVLEVPLISKVRKYVDLYIKLKKNP